MKSIKAWNNDSNLELSKLALTTTISRWSIERCNCSGEHIAQDRRCCINKQWQNLLIRKFDNRSKLFVEQTVLTNCFHWVTDYKNIAVLCNMHARHVTRNKNKLIRHKLYLKPYHRSCLRHISIFLDIFVSRISFQHLVLCLARCQNECRAGIHSKTHGMCAVIFLNFL